MSDEKIGEEPRKEDPPPVVDPEIRKGPLQDPPTKAPAIEDPPAEPHVPGDPAKKVEDPPVTSV